MLDTCVEDMCIPRQIRASETMRHYLADYRRFGVKKCPLVLNFKP